MGPGKWTVLAEIFAATATEGERPYSLYLWVCWNIFLPKTLILDFQFKLQKTVLHNQYQWLQHSCPFSRILWRSSDCDLIFRQFLCWGIQDLKKRNGFFCSNFVMNHVIFLYFHVVLSLGKFEEDPWASCKFSYAEQKRKALMSSGVTNNYGVTTCIGLGEFKGLVAGSKVYTLLKIFHIHSERIYMIGYVCLGGHLDCL